jgi:hypothetical protein
MPDEKPNHPIPALAYFPHQRSPALDKLVRLVVLFGAVNGLFSVFIFGFDLLGGGGTPLEWIDIGINIGQMFFWLAAAVSCVIVVLTGRGRGAAITAQAVAFSIDVCFYLRMIQQSGSPPPMSVQVLQTMAEIASDSLLPLLVVLVLIRPETQLAPPSV